MLSARISYFPWFPPPPPLGSHYGTLKAISCISILFSHSIMQLLTPIISLLFLKPYCMLVSCSGQAVHRCDGCPRSYRWVKSLIRHQRLECGKKPQFHCSFCEYQAKHKSSLVKHVALKHRVIPSDLS